MTAADVRVGRARNGFLDPRRAFSGNRTMIRIPIALLLFFSLCPLLPAQLKSEETEHLRLVYYHPSHAYLTEHMERCFVNALRFHSRLFDFQPSEKVTIFVEDFGDFGHGGAISFPNNMIKVGIEPFNLSLIHI